MNTYVVVGGGAAGFFGALACAEANPNSRIILLEKTRQPLAKVRISGGGRCNVTHHCFDPAELVKNYPRGHHELRGPFTRFQPRDTIAWFESRGVPIKAEDDGRMFPITDNSQTIIDCLMSELQRLKVDLRLECGVKELHTTATGLQLSLSNGETIDCAGVLLATGGTRGGFDLAKQVGHTVIDPVPSLFTFNIPDSPLNDLAGVSVESALVELPMGRLKQEGPLLITHWGFSGPAVLKLSAWGARALHAIDYRCEVAIHWLGSRSENHIREALTKAKEGQGARTIQANSPFSELPRKLWQRLVFLCDLSPEERWADLSKAQMNQLIQRLYRDTYQLAGKTTYKQEFVTSGGIALKEVNFTSMESRKCPRLYFAGEILDIDGVTGGFNFQAAWTTGWIAGNSMGCQI